MANRKLVRDKLSVPIQQTYPNSVFTKINGTEYEFALKQKLQEETQEFLQATSIDNLIEESADILEVLECLLALHNITISDVLAEKAAKQSNRGSFKDGLIWEK
ncbi:nucleoside triphosphate pyrophosphohydrolase [Enterococcus saccharolyticus]|uniref:nucleoside triphosphate pyrophosphohydrolase n=1 Tax=Enterococcus TaxID=1350 RepID=UPI001E5C0991|nr:nucleoside triphosphate pyrophosphohydrolase [Enterococcus saccharolyticus]MCD5002312.1 nucleoside triphosphate pyrophosphohydrolase [Enterococcus saccharolyticus]